MLSLITRPNADVRETLRLTLQHYGLEGYVRTLWEQRERAEHEMNAYRQAAYDRKRYLSDCALRDRNAEISRGFVA